MKNLKLLSRDFFGQPTLTVAQNLLGKTLSFNNIQSIITETEAYIGQDDPACHAFRGKTKRTEVMFGSAGYSYVYMIYGMYYCLNFVTEEEGLPAAVLIRAIEIDGIPKKNLNGLGKLCRYLGMKIQAASRTSSIIFLLSVNPLFILVTLFNFSVQISFEFYSQKSFLDG